MLKHINLKWISWSSPLSIHNLNLKMSCALRSQIGDLSQPNTGSQHLFKAVLHRYYWRKVGLQWMKRMGKGAILVLIWFLIIHGRVDTTSSDTKYWFRGNINYFITCWMASGCLLWTIQSYKVEHIATDSMEFFITSDTISSVIAEFV